MSGKNGGAGFLLGLRPRKLQGGDGKLTKCSEMEAIHWLHPGTGSPRTQGTKGWARDQTPQDDKPRLEDHVAAARCQLHFEHWLSRHLRRTQTPSSCLPISSHLPHTEMVSVSKEPLFPMHVQTLAFMCTLIHRHACLHV